MKSLTETIEEAFLEGFRQTRAGFNGEVFVEEHAGDLEYIDKRSPEDLEEWRELVKSCEPFRENLAYIKKRLAEIPELAGAVFPVVVYFGNKAYFKACF